MVSLSYCPFGICFYFRPHTPSLTYVSRAAASNAAASRQPRRAQAPLRLPLLGGRGREGGSPSIKSLRPWHLVSLWPSRGRSRSPMSAPPPCSEGRCWRCAAALSLSFPREFQNSTAWTEGVGRALLRPFPSPGGGGNMGHCPPKLPGGQRRLREPGRLPGSAQAAVSGLLVPTGTPNQFLCRGYCLGLSPWKSGGWRTLPQLSRKTPPAAKLAKLPQPQSPHGSICWSSAFPVGSFPRIGGGKGPF